MLLYESLLHFLGCIIRTVTFEQLLQVDQTKPNEQLAGNQNRILADPQFAQLRKVDSNGQGTFVADVVAI